MEKVRVAFIGAGKAARQFHYSSLSAMEDVEIAAVAELDEARLKEAADTYGVPGRYSDHREMLDREAVDAVYVITPPEILKPLVLDVIAAGRHVFLEKPAGKTTAETAEMAAAAERAGVKSAVGVNRRYARVFRRAKEEVLARGPVSTVLAEFHKDMPGEMFGMSVLHADAIHVLDAMRDVLGEAESVAAHADRWYTKERWPNSYNSFQALIRFEGGGSGLFTANRQCGARYERFEIHGKGISAYVRTPNAVEIFRTGAGEPEVLAGEELAGSADMIRTYGYFDENRDFIDCIKTGATPRTNLSDNLKTMRLCDLICAGGHVDRTEEA